MQPGPADLDLWLPRILGGTKASNVIGVTEALPVFDILVHKDNGVFRYKNCRVSQATFRGKSGPTEDEAEIINMSIGIIAMDEVEENWPGSEPSVPTGTGVVPYNFAQGTLLVTATQHPFDEFVLTINNMLQVRHRNSIKPTCVYSSGRIVRLEVDNPFTTTSWAAAKALYDPGTNGSLKFTNGARSVDFQFPLLRTPLETPVVRGKSEIPLSIKLEAYRTSGSAEISVENIS